MPFGNNRRRQRGTALVEFALVGIPFIFLWISVAEIARGMWQYHTIQYATKMANGYAASHGATCASPNSCAVNVSNVVGVFENYAIGIPMSAVTLTLSSSTAGNSITCNPVSTCSTSGSWSSQWPPSSNGDNAVGKPIQIKAIYSFTTALAMFFPGAGQPMQFSGTGTAGQFYLPGYSYELIQF